MMPDVVISDGRDVLRMGINLDAAYSLGAKLAGLHATQPHYGSPCLLCEVQAGGVALMVATAKLKALEEPGASE